MQTQHDAQTDVHVPELTQVRCNPPVASITLNRPDARNALSIELLSALHAAVDRVSVRTNGPAADVHVVTITGAGRCFCAGMDLKQVVSSDQAPGSLLSSLASLCIKVRGLGAVTVAVANGAAIGGGCGLVTVCDLAITHPDSKMGFPEVDLGVCPAVVAPWLVRKIGPARARATLLQGGLLSGREAHEHGIVDRLSESAQTLEDEARALTASLSRAGPEAVRATKSLMNQLDGSLDPAVAQSAAQLSAQVILMPETRAKLRQHLSQR